MVTDHLRAFEDMGMGGATIHCRTGLRVPYLGREFMRLVEKSIEVARERGMHIWLYDEDRWPSGYGGGLVTADPANRARHLLWTPDPYHSREGSGSGLQPTTAGTGRTGNGGLLYVFDVSLGPDGSLRSYRRVNAGDRARGRLWYAYLETASPQPWFNHQTYVDTLNGRAIRAFVRSTYDAYLRHCGGHFGDTVPAIFTDEPQFAHKQTLGRATDLRDLVIPWTDDLPESYLAQYGEPLEAKLPELFWELPGGAPSQTRYRYHDHVAERFADAFADTIGDWCGRHGIAFTGHMMEEPTLFSQTRALGEAMRSYRAFHLPGVDILCDHHPHTTGQRIEFTTVKQAQSASRQFGRQGVMSEIYGANNWDFTFEGHKANGDWQAALGVTSRVHHLALASLAGEAKRDYPPSLSYQVPWHREYRQIEDHFARLNLALTHGRPRVPLGVIHPIESYWLAFGPLEQTGRERDERERQFADLTQWLVHGLVDFDFICESLMTRQHAGAVARDFRVGRMRYRAVLVPGMRTIRGTTMDRLEALADAGGTVIFVGEVPTLVDAVPSDRPLRLAARTRRVPFDARSVGEAVEPYREIGVYAADGTPVTHLVHQYRGDGDERWLLLCNTDRAKGWDASPYGKPAVVRLRGRWDVERWDTLGGKIHRQRARVAHGHTEVHWRFMPSESLLLRLKPARGAARNVRLATPRSVDALPISERLGGPVRVTLSEPNCLLLDYAEWRLDGGDWNPAAHVLSVYAQVRRAVGLPPTDWSMAQPWTDRSPTPTLATVQLRFRVSSTLAVKRPLLAMENAAAALVKVSGRLNATKPAGWWVDRAIATTSLPDLRPGQSTIEVQLPLHRETRIEPLYLLGDFGVRVAGRHATLTDPVRELAFGDWSAQGLPFYAGNVTYHCQIAGLNKPLLLEVPHWRGPVMRAKLNGRDVGSIFLPPGTLPLGKPRAGRHRLDLTVYGNRFNVFGNVHYSGQWHWAHLGAPEGFYSTGRDWSDEYRLRPIGVLSAPIVRVGALA